MSTWSVADSRTPAQKDGIYDNVKDAITAAMESGLNVYVHADDCPPERELGPDCACRPLHLKRETPLRGPVDSWDPRKPGRGF